MHDPRLGAAFRAVRIRRGWRQADVADRARISRSLVGQVERGDIGRVQLDTVERIADALEIRVRVIARWRGADLDRLLSARHSALQDGVMREIASVPGWRALPEVSFAFYGERGIVDILAWHEPNRSLLVIEIKTELVDIPETLGTLDRKRRLAAQIARQHGWEPTSVSVWLILAASSMNRRHVSTHRALLRSALPADGHAMRSWLHRPDAGVSGLSLWSIAAGDGAMRNLAARKRVRNTGRTASHSWAPPR
jgi:transcriptional regulator with XRE-family HTH domain